ncbi:MAG: envelope integrity protein Cei [Pseudonocardia sp.]|nr:envelope integrity protein Cei [Pseudonocardia sp.]
MGTLRPYRRRRTRPVVVTVSVLAVLALGTWTVVLVNSAGATGLIACNSPADGRSVGTVVEPDALADVAPVPAAAVRATVFNAGGQRGQANLVAAQLGDLGVAEAAPPNNDPFFPDGDLDCRGQIRFGQAGQGAAVTLSLILPCTELVRDERADDTVDVAVGTGFADVKPGRATKNVLDQLANPGGATADGQAAGPSVDPDDLAAAREAPC